MNPDRRRVSLSLTAQEYEQLLSISDYLGIKPTSAAHRALTQGLSIIFNEGQKLKTNLQFAQINESAKKRQSKAAVNPSEPPRKQTQIKDDGGEVVTTLAHMPASTASTDSEIKAARKALERLSIHDRKILEKSYGSLTNAAKLGVRAHGRNFSVPDEIQPQLKIPANRAV